MDNIPKTTALRLRFWWFLFYKPNTNIGHKTGQQFNTVNLQSSYIILGILFQDTGAGTLKFAYKNYEASHEEEDQDGDLIVYGPCHYNDLQSRVSATIANK